MKETVKIHSACQVFLIDVPFRQLATARSPKSTSVQWPPATPALATTRLETSEVCLTVEYFDRARDCTLRLRIQISLRRNQFNKRNIQFNLIAKPPQIGYIVQLARRIARTSLCFLNEFSLHPSFSVTNSYRSCLNNPTGGLFTTQFHAG